MSQIPSVPDMSANAFTDRLVEQSIEKIAQIGSSHGMQCYLNAREKKESPLVLSARYLLVT